MIEAEAAIILEENRIANEKIKLEHEAAESARVLESKRLADEEAARKKEDE